MTSIGKINTSVHRPQEFKTWSLEHRWGQMIGDVRTLSITKYADGSMKLKYGRDELQIRDELASAFLEMIDEARVWEAGQ